MGDEPNNLVLRYLRDIDRKLDRLIEDVDDPKSRMSRKKFNHPCDPNNIYELRALCQRYFEERNELICYLSALWALYGKDNDDLEIALGLIFGLHWIDDPNQSRRAAILKEAKTWRLPNLIATIERLLEAEASPKETKARQ